MRSKAGFRLFAVLASGLFSVAARSKQFQTE